MNPSPSRLADWGWDLLGWVVVQLITVVSWGTARQRPVLVRWLAAPLWIPAIGLLAVLLLVALFDAQRHFPSTPRDPRVIPFRRPRRRP